MQNILKSASKLVLLYIIGLLGLLTLFVGVWSVINGTYGEAEKLVLGGFNSTLTFVLGFYFGSKGEPNEPYAGK